MAQTNKKVTKDFLQSFADAFNAHNVNAIMLHMTNDCVFEASAGPDIDGEKFTGPRRFRRTFHPVLHYDDSFNGVALQP